MNSPLRSGDKNPSFGIFHSKTGGLLWKDLGTGECGNSLKFLKEYKGITTREELERELLRIVRRINPNTIVRTNTYDKPAWRCCNESRNKDRKSTRLNSSHSAKSRMPSSA